MEKNNVNNIESSAKEFATKLYPEKTYGTFLNEILTRFRSLATNYYSRGYMKAQEDRKKLDRLRKINFNNDFKKVLNDINMMIDSKHKA